MLDVGGENGPATGKLATHELRLDVFAQGDEAHLLRDDATARVVHLAKIAVRRRQASFDPWGPARRQTLPGVDALGPAGVVDGHVGRPTALMDHPERHVQLAAADLVGVGETLGQGACGRGRLHPLGVDNL